MVVIPRDCSIRVNLRFLKHQISLKNIRVICPIVIRSKSLAIAFGKSDLRRIDNSTGMKPLIKYSKLKIDEFGVGN